MKRTWNWLLMATLVVGLGMCVTSCKDDDDEKDNKSEEKQYEEKQNASNIFWNVVGQLTSIDNYTADYEGKTFEPTIGDPLDGNNTVRVVATENMAAAAERFANLVDVSDVNESTQDYEWKHDAVGKLTYHKSTDGQSLATVDVNIKAMPGLQKIVYRTVDQAGTNGTFNGTPWYRFGDVVKRTYTDKDDGNKQKEEYWVCVRPAVGPAGKEDTHWITVSPLPKKNIFSYEYGGTKYSVPTGIGTNKEQMQNLAELIYAIMYTDKWAENLEKSPKPKMWHDFLDKRMPLNNKWFFKSVANAWEKGGSKSERRKEIAAVLFGYTQMQLTTAIDNNGLSLLYSGYSWWTKTSWNCSLYEAKYSPNGTGTEANMHKNEFRTVKKNVENIKTLDIATTYTLAHPYLISEEFFDNRAPRWIIRHATGKELYGSKPSVYTSIASTANGIEDYYTYNSYYGITVNSQTPPEECTEELYKQRAGIEDKPEGPDPRWPYYEVGDVLRDETDQSRWICFRGSSQKFSKDEEDALFVSFDNIQTNGKVATNIIKDDENFIHDMFYFTRFIDEFTSVSNNTAIPFILQSVLQYAQLDPTSLCALRDSVYIIVDKEGKPVTEKTGGQLNSISTSTFFNVAYDDGSTDRQALLRVVYDNTRAGRYRTADKVDDMMYWRFYKHYQKFDPNRNYTEEETKQYTTWTGWSKWVLPWVVTTRKIYLQDVADQSLVDEYSQDKWVVLPLKDQAARGQRRTTADANAKNPSNYFFKNGAFATNSTGMYNEPVLFIRIMRLHDGGEHCATSPEGHPLTVLNHITDPEFQRGQYSHIWFVNMLVNRATQTYVDDQQFVITP